MARLSTSPEHVAGALFGVSRDGVLRDGRLGAAPMMKATEVINIARQVLRFPLLERLQPDEHDPGIGAVGEPGDRH